jgi:hypothetical protein
MSLPIENEIFMQKWNARRTSSLTHIQTHKQQFDANDLIGSAAAGAGRVAREGADNDPDGWRDDITDCESYASAALKKLGDSDPGLTEQIRNVLAALQELHRVPNGTLVRKASINRGQTSKPHVYPTNSVSRKSHTVSTSEFRTGGEPLFGRDELAFAQAARDLNGVRDGESFQEKADRLLALHRRAGAH